MLFGMRKLERVEKGRLRVSKSGKVEVRARLVKVSGELGIFLGKLKVSHDQLSC
jgi:hypothetical protein